jgi:ABC-type glutathione transport system ATPase component
VRIELDGVTKRFGPKTAVDRVSVQIGDGELLVLLGPSGSGKSTLLSIVAGLLETDEGQVRFDGAPAPKDPRRRSVGMVFQDLALWPHMTVEQHLAFVAPGIDPAPIFDMLELGPHRKALPAALSGGEAQRLAIARALACRPKVLLFDEPFGPLDRRIREKLLDLFPDIRRRFPATTIFVTHDYDEAFRIADRVAVLVEGKLAQVGRPEEVYLRPTSPIVAELTGPVSDGLRPEELSAERDETSTDVVVASRFRAGGWLVQVDRAGKRVLASSSGPLPPGTPVRVERLIP